MARPVRLGMLTPSSNTVVEPVTMAMVRDLAGVSVHFSRFKVTEISLAKAALDQFDLAPFLDAADLLADARVDVIAWNGTSSAWLGFDADQRLCRAIDARFGVPATASMLAINQALAAAGVERIALVTPYIDQVQDRIVANYSQAGFRCVAERHTGVSVNHDFAEVADGEIAAMVRGVASAAPEAIVVACTNLRAAPLVDALERELDIPIYDSLATVVWRSLRLAGVNPRAIRGFGRLFATAPD